MQNGDLNKNVAGSAEPIVPIDFKPNDAKGSGRTFKLKWIHGVFAVFVLVFGTAAWFVLTARSVFVEVDPITAEFEISGGLNFRVGPRYLIRTGSYDIALRNPGYHDANTQLLVSNDQSQTHTFTMRRLPGIVSIGTLGVDQARVQIDGIDIGTTPLIDIPVEAGEHRLTISRDRYLEYNDTINIEGRSVEQRFQVELNPAWAVVSIDTSPPGAEVLVDGEQLGFTPINAELLQGERDLMVKLSGHKAWQERLDIIAGEDFSLPRVELEPADGLVFIRSTPNAASVTINGEFKGLTPLEVSLAPDEDHALTFFKNGYEQLRSTVRTQPEQEREILVELDPVTASVQIVSEPQDAELYIDGEFRGLANQTIELMAASQQIEIRRDGYLPYTTEFTSRPGLDQVIRVTLKSLEQARLEQIRPVVRNPAGQDMKLFYPGAFTMGASRREPGRGSNENLRNVQLERPFYLSFREVTNAQFRLFDSEHSSGTIQGITLDNQAQPAVRLTWNQAALFCNWLSEQEGLPLFYEVVDDEVVGFNPDSHGYRLPSEAEWAWVARTDGSGVELRYPWGTSLPPPPNSGNFADVTTQAYLGEIMFDYNDGHFATAPVGSFNPNYHGIFDMAGNVAEWVHDFYGSGSLGVETDPLGADVGQFHVIRGSSWAHGAITEMRLSFRDFGLEGRDDVGFRVARYLEDITVEQPQEQ